MILVTGGAAQGKEAWAREHFPGREVICAWHERVREQLQAGLDPMQEAQRLLHEHPQAVVISDEIGCGVVPIDPGERHWREASGRVSCFLAAQASQVYRVICGIGRRIR